MCAREVMGTGAPVWEACAYVCIWGDLMLGRSGVCKESLRECVRKLGLRGIIKNLVKGLIERLSILCLNFLTCEIGVCPASGSL